MTSPSETESARDQLPAEKIPQVPRQTFLVLAAVVSVGLVLSGVFYIIWVLTGYEASPINEAYHIFDVAGEFNGGAWLNSVLWLLLAVATAIVAAHTKKRRASWVFFTAVAAYASLDEFAMLHERLYRLGGQIAHYLPFDPFTYRWVIAGLGLALIVVVLLAPLMLSLPRRVLIGYIVAGSVFLVGAVVVESISGAVDAHFGVLTWHLKLVQHVEEGLEMMGVALAIANTTAMLRWCRTSEGLSTAFTGYRR